MQETYKKAFGTLLIAVQLYAGVAFAAPPANVVGTWTVQVNQDEEEFIIESQGAPGTCKAINGKVNVTAEPKIRGFYCPSTGRIHFHHRNAATNVTVRTFTGNVADTVEGVSDKMAGTVMINNTQFGTLGERNFSATRE